MKRDGGVQAAGLTLVAATALGAASFA